MKRIGRRYYAFPLFCLVVFLNTKGQCPSKDSIRSMIMTASYSAADPNSRLRALQSIEETTKSCGFQNDSVYALLLQRMGVQYYYLKQFQKASFLILSSVHLNNSRRAAVNPANNIQNYYILSAIYTATNDIRNKSTTEDSLLSISFRFQILDERLLNAIYSKAEENYEAGDYYGSMDFARLYENLNQKLLGESAADQKRMLGNSFSAMHWIINSLIALKFYDSAETMLAEKRKIYEQQFREYLGIYYHQFAELYIAKGDKTKALEYYQKSLGGFFYNADTISIRKTFNNIGFQIYSGRNNDPRRAIEYYRKALTYGRSAKDSLRETRLEYFNFTTNIAKDYAELSNYDSSLAYIDKAMRIFCGSCKLEDFTDKFDEMFSETDMMRYFLSIYPMYANVYKQKYLHTGAISDLEFALKIYSLGDQFLEKTKRKNVEQGSKLFWRSYSRELYENAIHACWLKKDINKAFYFFERSRAVLLLDQLRNQKRMGEAEFQEWKELSTTIQQLKSKRKNVKGGLSMEEQADLIQANDRAARLNAELKMKNPLYGQDMSDTFAITIRSAQDLLKDFQSVVEIFEGENAVYVLAITPSTHLLRKIESRSFTEAKRKYTDFLATAEMINKNFMGFRENSRKLYNLLFESIRLPEGRMIFSPDADYFPLESLLVSDQGQEDYFVLHHAVTYAYSLSFFRNSYDKLNSQGGKQFMGMAPVKFPSNFKLPALYGSDESINFIAEMYQDSKVFSNAMASRKNFMKNFYDYNIIQLYSHASDNSDRKEPLIYFSDSALYLSELIGEKIPATRLVVLSACETAGGKLYLGEGVFNFNRAFASLGVPSCVTNLWAIDNQSTYQITEFFYKNLATGDPFDVALQKAKIDFLRSAKGEKKLPSYWAAPILAGKTNQFEPKTGLSKIALSLMIGLPLVALLVLLGLFVRRKNINPSQHKAGIAA